MIASYLFMVFSWIAVILPVILIKKSFPALKGRYGEKMVMKTLKNLDSKEYTIFHDLYVPTKRGTCKLTMS